MAIDFEAEGLLDGVEEERARQSRLDLLRSLEDAGFSLDELRRATQEGRLAMLPVERVLAEEPRYTQRDLSELTGVDLDLLAEARRATGAPAVGPDDRMLTDDDLELAQGAAALLKAGLDREQFLDLVRVMSRAMANVAAGLTAIFGEAFLHPDDTELDLSLRYAESVQNLGPLAAPTLGNLLSLHLRETLRNVVVSDAELRSGRLPGAQPVTIGFVDIVGFTQLGEEIPPEELGALVREFERAADDAAMPPVRLVKTIGDAAMLVAPEPKPVLEAVLSLVQESRAGGALALLRGGVASGGALQRAGDWYGRPVNLASRLTTFARRGSVVASKEVHDATSEDYDWSFAGYRRFKGVGNTVPVWRVRPRGEKAPAAD